MEDDWPIDWWAEARTALVVVCYVAVFGALAGVVWHAVAPVVDPQGALSGSTAVSKLLIGDDVWLGFIGIVAGVLSVLGVVLVAPKSVDGPGALIGLVAGGCLAMLVADRVGHLIGVPGLASTIRHDYPTATASGVAYVVAVYDFKARMTAVLLSWPLASLLVSAAITWVRALNQPTARVVSAYPGSP